MTVKRKPLIIVGDSAFAEVAFEYFSCDSEYEVVAFSVEKKFLTKSSLCDLPIVAFEDLANIYNPDDYHVYVAVTYGSLNRVRARLVAEVKDAGFSLASYVSSRAHVWRNANIGEHCFIFEENVVQPFVKIGNNVVIWSGNHIGHHSLIEDNCFIASHVVISGYSVIGKNSFLGVNSTISNNVTVAHDNWIGPSVTISADTNPGDMYRAHEFKPTRVSAYRFFRIKNA